MKRFLLGILWCAGLHAFTTLDDFKAFVDAYPEIPEIDVVNWRNPNYSALYEESRPGIFQRIAYNIGLMKRPVWNPTRLAEVLRTLNAQRSPASEPIVFDLNPEDELIIWGDLQGAAHSLYYCLKELEKQEVIDSQLRILKPNCYFIFLGDAIDRSPYSIETLSMIAHLMLANPEQVIYLRGEHESNGYWENFNLANELRIKAAHLAEHVGAIPLKSEINTFFDTLPPEMLIRDPKSQDQIYVAHSNKNINTFSLSKKDIKWIKHTKAIIRGEARSEMLSNATGLDLLGFSLGAAEWSVLSCPVQVYRVFFNFFNDAFVRIQLSDAIEKTVMTLYTQDARHREGFLQHKCRSVKYGVALNDPADVKEYSAFNIGSSMAIESGIGSQGILFRQGMDAFFSKLSEAGGVDHVIIKPYILEDGYIPYRAYKNAQRLVEDLNIRTFLTPTGSPTLEKYIDYLQEKDAYVFFPSSASPEFRKPEMTNIVHFRPSFIEEGRALIEYALDTYGITKFAFFYQDDSFGRPFFQAARDVLKERGITEWLELPYTRGQTQFEEFAEKVKTFNPSSIALFAVSDPAILFINSLGISTLLGKPFIASEDLNDERFKQYASNTGIEVVVSQVVPDPSSSNLPIVKEYRESIGSRGLPYNTFSLESYITGSLLAESLRHITKPFTPSKMMQWFEGLHSYNFKGLNLTFDAQTRGLGQKVHVAKIGDE